jgi:hypothetical protein
LKIFLIQNQHQKRHITQVYLKPKPKSKANFTLTSKKKSPCGQPFVPRNQGKKLAARVFTSKHEA